MAEGDPPATEPSEPAEESEDTVPGLGGAPEPAVGGAAAAAAGGSGHAGPQPTGLEHGPGAEAQSQLTHGTGLEHGPQPTGLEHGPGAEAQSQLTHGTGLEHGPQPTGLEHGPGAEAQSQLTHGTGLEHGPGAAQQAQLAEPAHGTSLASSGSSAPPAGAPGARPADVPSATPEPPSPAAPATTGIAAHTGAVVAVVAVVAVAAIVGVVVATTGSSGPNHVTRGTETHVSAVAATPPPVSGSGGSVDPCLVGVWRSLPLDTAVQPRVDVLQQRSGLGGITMTISPSGLQRLDYAGSEPLRIADPAAGDASAYMLETYHGSSVIPISAEHGEGRELGKALQEDASLTVQEVWPGGTSFTDKRAGLGVFSIFSPRYVCSGSKLTTSGQLEVMSWVKVSGR